MTKKTGLRYRLAHATGHQWRDTITYVIGAGGLIFETLTDGAEKPTLIIAFVGMLGLPLFLRTDRQNAKDEAAPVDTPSEVKP